MRAPSLTSDPIPELTLRIGVPVGIGMFFNTMFNFVDTYCASLLGTNAVAAISLSFPLFFLLIAVGSGLSQAATSLIANALGAGDREGARLVFSQSLLFAVGAGILVCAVGLLSAPAIFSLLGASGDYLAQSIAYMRVIYAGGVFFVVTMALNSALAAQGETGTYRNFLICGCAANCALNPILMWGLVGLPPLGVGGIALATVLVQIAGCLLLWRHVSQSRTFQSLPAGHFRPNVDVLLRIASQSVPTTLNMITIAAGVFVITWFVRPFGKEAVAAMGIASKIEQIVLMPAIGLSSAMISITGQNYGRGLPSRIQEAWRTNIRIGVCLMLLAGLIVGCFGAPLMRVFTSDELIVFQGGQYLRAAACTLAAYPILFVTVFLMQGLKRPAYGLVMGAIRQVVGPLLVFNLLVSWLGLGIQGVWWGFCLVTWAAAAIGFLYGKITTSRLVHHSRG